MSVQRYETADGVRWRVRWREGNGHMRSRTVGSKREALALDADVKARKYKGDALPRAGRDTLATAYDEWWRLRGSTLAPHTQRVYKYAWDAHIRDRFDGHRLNELAAEPQLLEELTADMRDRGHQPSDQRHKQRLIGIAPREMPGARKEIQLVAVGLVGARGRNEDRSKNRGNGEHRAPSKRRQRSAAGLLIVAAGQTCARDPFSGHGTHLNLGLE